MLSVDKAEQYLRKFDLVVFGSDFEGLNLSELRCKFVVKRSDTMTPNIADIRVYNVAEQTALRIRQEFKRVVLQAGYEGNYGVIFQGNIKQVIIGRESATDTYIDIVAGDGDRAYNFSIVNTTLAGGSGLADQVQASIGSMAPNGVAAGFLGDFGGEVLPRAKVMYGNSRNYLRDVAQTTNKTWSIQDEKVTFVSKKSYLPGERVVLTSKTGMIGTPQQTNEGVNVKCLLNPMLKIGGLVDIDNKSIERLKINLSVAGSPSNIPAPLTADGAYYLLVVEHQGDTRGVDWYSNLICLNADISANPRNAVQTNYGG